MKVKLRVNIFSQKKKAGITFFKCYESTIIPVVGTLIQDPIFAELKPIERVIINYSEDTCYVDIERKEMPVGRLDGHVQEVAELHGWKEKI